MTSVISLLSTLWKGNIVFSPSFDPFQAPLLVSVVGGTAPLFFSLEEINLPPYYRRI